MKTANKPKTAAIQNPEGHTLLVPGTWRPTQSLGGRVLQYVWSCPFCKRVEYVLCSPPSRIEFGSRRLEHCPCMLRPAKGEKDKPHPIMEEFSAKIYDARSKESWPQKFRDQQERVR